MNLRWLLTVLLLLAPAGVQAQSKLAESQRKSTIEQRLGEQAPLDVQLRDESGRAVSLGQYFGERPVILVLNYFRCPRLCSVVLNELLVSLRANPLNAGKDF